VALAVVAIPLLPGSPNRPDPIAGNQKLWHSAEFQAYLQAHRDSAVGAVTSPSEYVLPAALTTESR